MQLIWCWNSNIPEQIWLYLDCWWRISLCRLGISSHVIDDLECSDVIFEVQRGVVSTTYATSVVTNEKECAQLEMQIVYFILSGRNWRDIDWDISCIQASPWNVYWRVYGFTDFCITSWITIVTLCFGQTKYLWLGWFTPCTRPGISLSMVRRRDMVQIRYRRVWFLGRHCMRFLTIKPECEDIVSTINFSNIIKK